VLRRNPHFLEKATLDVDNDGSVEDVYRVAGAQPVNAKDPSGAWTIYSCNGSSPDGYPSYGFFFLPEKTNEMGTIARVGLGYDLFRYRARTFMTTIDSNFMAQVDWLETTSSGPRQGFFSQACFITLDKPK